MRVLLVGSGYMGIEYSRVLTNLKADFEVIGRGEEKLNVLSKEFPEVKTYSGGIEANMDKLESYTHAIVGVNVESLYKITCTLLDNGIKNILVEKPAGLDPEEMDSLCERAEKHKANVLLGYNRRFYIATQEAKKTIAEDGGILSVHFEFTEWAHTIDPVDYAKKALERWIVSNSSHVIDTVFYLAGSPKEMASQVSGDTISWHPSGTTFTGSGITVNDVPFTYHANWAAPGRWAIEILTANNRLYLKPMEKLQIQKKGTVSVDFVEDIDYSLEETFKPGVHQQTEAFLKGEFDEFCTIFDQRTNMQHYFEIGGY